MREISGFSIFFLFGFFSLQIPGGAIAPPVGARGGGSRTITLPPSLSAPDTWADTRFQPVGVNILYKMNEGNEGCRSAQELRGWRGGDTTLHSPLGTCPLNSEMGRHRISVRGGYKLGT